MSALILPHNGASLCSKSITLKPHPWLNKIHSEQTKTDVWKELFIREHLSHARGKEESHYSRIIKPHSGEICCALREDVQLILRLVFQQV